MTNFEIMKISLGVLTQEERDNLRFHLTQNTPILCGRAAALYLDGTGAG